jgi:hypothetical protein
MFSATAHEHGLSIVTGNVLLNTLDVLLGAGSITVCPTSPLSPCRRNAPELNPVKNIVQFMRDNWLSSRSSNPTTISSITAARLGTTLLNNPDTLCPSDCTNGRTGSDQ